MQIFFAKSSAPSPQKGRLTIGGYGEAAMKRCFYSNNYLPIPEVVIKGEFGHGILNQNPYSATRYNNEPYVALSINYCRFFIL